MFACRRRRAFLVVAVCLFAWVLGGCHFSSIIFDRLDWLVMNQIDDSFDLSWREEREVKPLVKEWVQWTKREELNPLLTMAKDLHASARTPWTKDQLAAFWERLVHMRVAIVAHGAPVAAAFLKARSDEQWQYLLKTAQEKDEKARALLDLEPSAYDEAYAKKLLKPRVSFCETWLGPLRDDQKAWLASAWAESSSTLRARLLAREAMYATFVAEVKSTSVADLAKKLLAWADDPALLAPVAMRAAYLRQKDESMGILSHLSETLDARQRQHLLQKVANLIDDLEGFRLKS